MMIALGAGFLRLGGDRFRHPGCTFTSPADLAKHIAYTAILDVPQITGRLSNSLPTLGVAAETHPAGIFGPGAVSVCGRLCT